MLDPELFPLFFGLLGKVGGGLLKKAAESHVEKYFGRALDRIGNLGQKSDIEAAVEKASALWVETTLKYLAGLGYGCEELQEYGASFAELLQDEAVGEELVRLVADSEACQGESVEAKVFDEAWHRLECQPLPAEFRWPAALRAYQKQFLKQRTLIPGLRDILNAESLEQLRAELVRQGGIRPSVDERRYAERMRQKYCTLLDLSALAPATAEEGEPPQLLEVFVPQDVRKNPPQVELPRDLLRRVMGPGRGEEKTENRESLDDRTQELLEQVRGGYARQPRLSVLEALSRPQNRAAVLLGDPGSGKSTLMRYLLLALLDPPQDPSTGRAAAWTEGFAQHLPLLIEIREFVAQRDRGGYESFVDFLHFLGRTQGYHLDDQWLARQLSERPCLVLFDGLDEVFEPAERERIAHQIVGFASEYPAARIVVTSRPIGFPEVIFKAAGFQPLALQDLSDEQVAVFVVGWFRRVFPDRPAEAEVRVGRILEAVAQSRSIRLLAGNPMLLTIMALMARQQELPQERYRFYEFSAEVLCYHWDMNRHLRDSGLKADYIGVDDKKELLRRIAYHMQDGKGGLAGNFIHADDLRQEFEAYLRDRYQVTLGDAKSLAQALVEQLRSRNYIFCLYGAGLYGFVHRTFLEYFCASELVRRLHENPVEYPIDSLLREAYDAHWRDPSWHEVLRLICARAGETYSAKIIEHLIASTYPDWQEHLAECPPTHLVLAVRCLADVRNRPAIGFACHRLLLVICEMLELSLLKSWHLASMTGDLIEAVREVGSAWPGSNEFRGTFFERLLNRSNELLSSAYADFGISLFGQDATFRAQLAGLVAQDPKPPELVESQTKEIPDHVRAAVLQALARGRALAIRLLLVQHATGDKSSHVRGTALTALAREWGNEVSVLYLVERLLLEDRSSKVRRAAVQAIAGAWAADPGAVALLRQSAVEDKHPQVRRAALQALFSSQAPDAGLREFLHGQLQQDHDPYVQIAALEALVRGWPEDSAIQVLLHETIVMNPDPFLRGSSLEILSHTKRELREVRELLRERACQDEDSYVRRKACGNLVRLQLLDTDAVRLLSENFDGFDPFRDPRSALPPLDLCAERLRLEGIDLRQRVDDYSRVLGWDLLVGIGSPVSGTTAAQSTPDDSQGGRRSYAI